MHTNWTRGIAAVAFGTLLGTALTACSSGSGGNTASGGGNTITLWTHNGGNDAELAADQKVVDDYNASQTKYQVKLQSFPQASYNDAVVAAASAKKLPCVLDVDSPNVPNWAWGGYLAPIDMTGAEVPLSAQLPSTVGTYQGKTYSFGLYDVALTFFARKSVLQKYGIRIATVDSPWTKDEFMAALAKLKASGQFKSVLDEADNPGSNGGGEWYSYAYLPQLQSFGGDQIDRNGYTSADDALAGPAAVEWATWFRSLVTDGYMPPSGTSPNNDFLNGKTAIEYDGSWDAAANLKALGKDLAIIPPVDFGKGPKIGGGSWQWGMSAGCSNPTAAQDFLKFMRQTKYFADVAKATGTIPAVASAAKAAGYAPGGPLSVFMTYAQKFAEVRPVTPAYPYISTVFAKAVSDILAGGDPKGVLDQAASEIDQNIKSNDNYQD